MKNIVLLLLSLFIVFSCAYKEESNLFEEQTIGAITQKLPDGNFLIENVQMTWKGVENSYYGKLIVASGDVSVVEGNMQKASFKVDMSSFVDENPAGQLRDIRAERKKNIDFTVGNLPEVTFQLIKSEFVKGKVAHTDDDHDDDGKGHDDDDHDYDHDDDGKGHDDDHDDDGKGHDDDHDDDGKGYDDHDDHDDDGKGYDDHDDDGKQVKNYDSCVACVAGTSEGRVLQVTGDFTVKIKGQEKVSRVTFPVFLSSVGDILYIKANFVIDRVTWEVKYTEGSTTDLEVDISNEIKITLDIKSKQTIKKDNSDTHNGEGHDDDDDHDHDDHDDDHYDDDHDDDDHDDDDHDDDDHDDDHGHR